jgi:excisionase family DNA binding protein
MTKELQSARPSDGTASRSLVGPGTLCFVFDLPPEALETIADRAARILEERSSSTAAAIERRYLNVPEAADYLRSSRQRVYDLLSSGRLRRYKDGSRVLVSRAELDAYLSDGAVASRQRTRPLVELAPSKPKS